MRSKGSFLINNKIVHTVGMGLIMNLLQIYHYAKLGMEKDA